MYGNDKDYFYHFKEPADAGQIRAALPDWEVDVDPSHLPDYATAIYVWGTQSIDDVIERLRAVGLDPVPEEVADEPWEYKPEKETIEEYRVRIGIAD